MFIVCVFTYILCTSTNVYNCWISTLWTYIYIHIYIYPYNIYIYKYCPMINHGIILFVKPPVLDRPRSWGPCLRLRRIAALAAAPRGDGHGGDATPLASRQKLPVEGSGWVGDPALFMGNPYIAMDVFPLTYIDLSGFLSGLLLLWDFKWGKKKIRNHINPYKSSGWW